MKMTFKKGILAVAAAGSLCAIGITSGGAAGPANGSNYIDLNHDGICDRVSSISLNYIDLDQDGICDHREDCRQCNDQNQDGLCDWCGKALTSGTPAGAGQNYVDANQDGICDHYSTNHHAGQGNRHHGNHH